MGPIARLAVAVLQRPSSAPPSLADPRVPSPFLGMAITLTPSLADPFKPSADIRPVALGVFRLILALSSYEACFGSCLQL